MSDPEKLDRLFDIPDPFADASDVAPPMPRLPETKSPTRAERERAVAIAIGAALLYQIAWVLVIEHRTDLGKLPFSALILSVGIPLYLAFGAANVASRGGLRGLGMSVSRLTLVIVGAPLIFALETLLLSSRMTDETAPFWDRAVRCIAVTFMLAVPPMAMLTWVFRRAFVAASVWRSAALGVACGALGAATMSVACVHSEALHIIVAHGSMMILGGVGGALLGRFVTRA
jgi:hypothetical protein